jgi:hypothetical protein
VELHAAGVLAALAATVMAAQCVAARARLAVLLGTFVAAAALLAWRAILDVEALAFCIAAAHAAAFLRPRWSWVPPIAGGIAAAGWLSVLRAQGLPWLPAALAAAALLVVTIGLVKRRPAFMSDEVRDEALVLVGVSALLLATGPTIVDGWRSGLALTAEPLAAPSSSVGPWLGVLVLGCVALGGVYTAWKRR